jgi:choline-sulfatase
MSEKPPNIVCILTDDQGVWAAGCYGNDEIRTPGIDRIAESGVRFENFFVATPVCSPSRATLLTGRIPSQHGVHDWIRGGNMGSDAVSYLANEVTYTDILAENGWDCGLSGKWHLGDSQIPQHGFKHWFVHQGGGGPYRNAPMIRDGQPITAPGYVTNVITDDAIAYLVRHAHDDMPFYLGVHYTAPHSPWDGHPQHIVDSYDACLFESCPQEPIHPCAVGLTHDNMGNRDSMKGYFAAVTAMDEDVCRILDRLEQLGIRNNTLVIFLSDNGFSLGHHGFWGKGNGTFPANMYENSIRVPAVMSHPDRIPQGIVQSAMFSACDFMPTLLTYLDLPVPTDRNLSGTAMVPTWLGEDTGAREHVVICDEYGDTRMIRTNTWKYVHRFPSGPDELYDLVKDPDERTNLASIYDYQGQLTILRRDLDAWFERYADPAMDGRDRGVTGLGQLRPIRGVDTATGKTFADQDD